VCYASRFHGGILFRRSHVRPSRLRGFPRINTPVWLADQSDILHNIRCLGFRSPNISFHSCFYYLSLSSYTACSSVTRSIDQNIDVPRNCLADCSLTSSLRGPSFAPQGRHKRWGRSDRKVNDLKLNVIATDIFVTRSSDLEQRHFEWMRIMLKVYVVYSLCFPKLSLRLVRIQLTDTHVTLLHSVIVDSY